MDVKKIGLSMFVIVSFILYSAGLRGDNTHTKVSPVLPNGQTNTIPANAGTATATQTSTTYKDGTYVGSVADAFYGNIQVKATITGGKITAVQFLQYPNDRPNSVEINQQAMPLLQQEAIQVQSSRVNGVSGATDTSLAFIQSLSDALAKAM